MQSCGERGSAAERLGEQDQRWGRGRILLGNSDGIAFGHFGEQEGGNRGRGGPSRVVVFIRTRIRGPGRGGIGRGLGYGDVAAGAGGVHDIACGLLFTWAAAGIGYFARHPARKGNRTGSPAVGRQGKNQCDVDEGFHDVIVAEGCTGRNYRITY